ncbi:hypothetical protein J132_03079 [Termitomyces sp. J132]|nr:hypothetical protein J132_03079 [Termitomyces sp. J132]
MPFEVLDEWTFHVQSHAIENSTASGYVTGAHDYINFCISHNLPLDLTPLTLLHYIAFTSCYIASGMRYFTGLGHFLKGFCPDFDVNRAHSLVQAAIHGSKKIQADPVHQKLPIQLSHLSDLVKLAELSDNYNDSLFATIMSYCFYACHRSGEIIQKSKSKTDWRKVTKCYSLHFPLGYAGYHLPHHEADPFFHGTDILFTHHDIADPVDFLYKYVIKCNCLHGACLAWFIQQDGSHPTRS